MRHGTKEEVKFITESFCVCVFLRLNIPGEHIMIRVRAIPFEKVVGVSDALKKKCGVVVWE